MIEKLRKKINTYINKYGTNSYKTQKVSQELDEYINMHNQSNIKMWQYYYNSIEGLKEYLKQHDNIPDAKQWNKYAYENKYLSSESIKYMSGKNFSSWCKFQKNIFTN